MTPAPNTSRTASAPDYESSLVAAIIIAQEDLRDEQCGSRRPSVIEHYRARIRDAMAELARVNPRHSLLPAIPQAEPDELSDPVDRLRADLALWLHKCDDTNAPAHIRALAFLRAAEIENELARLTGRKPAIDLAEAQRVYEDMIARSRRPAQAHFSHLQQNQTGVFVPRGRTSEIELVSDPTTEALRARRARRADIALWNQPLSLGGAPTGGGVTYASAAPYDVRDRGAVRTRA